jgi:hypothetical protein
MGTKRKKEKHSRRKTDFLPKEIQKRNSSVGSQEHECTIKER